MTHTLKIDFVSDISCPWCAIGLQSLETAVSRLQGEVEVQLHFQPFELNPQMAPEGEDITEHLGRKYGSTPEQAAAARENIPQRGEALGLTFNMDKRARIYNTFDAHRLLHWAADTGRQTALKKALFTAYFTEGKDPSQHAVLIDAAVSAGLSGEEARAVLEGDEFAAVVREQEQFYTGAGIHSVPAVIINDRHLISGGQPPEVFEQALRQIAAG
jgi:predicted DsbA family dithiol-disulfide isomerase